MTPTLIIADDNRELGEVLARAARRKGWEVRLCENGAELVEAVRPMTEPALALIDVLMPEVDGIEAIEALARLDRAARLRLRFLTGGDAVGAIAARMIAEARGFSCGKNLFKPLGLETFGTVLAEEHVHLARMAQETGDR